MPTLYLVATPIGNLEDISPRALETLRTVALVAAEDTRTARQLLTHFEIHTPITSFFEHSRLTKLDRILETLERDDVAVISEAGMPGINDPGYDLVKAAIDRGIRVSPVPGPSAVLTALVGSGMAAGAFYYVGFLPREPQGRRKFLHEIANESSTVIAFETPHRLRGALDDMVQILGETRQICVARELTKKFEEFQRGTLGQVRAHFTAQEPRGEFTLVIAGHAAYGGAQAHKAEVWNDARVRREFQKLVADGMPRTEAVKQIARAAGRERRAVYDLTSGNTR